MPEQLRATRDQRTGAHNGPRLLQSALRVHAGDAQSGDHGPSARVRLVHWRASPAHSSTFLGAVHRREQANFVQEVSDDVLRLIRANREAQRLSVKGGKEFRTTVKAELPSHKLSDRVLQGCTSHAEDRSCRGDAQRSPCECPDQRTLSIFGILDAERDVDRRNEPRS